MAQFDIYENINRYNNKDVPYFMDIQHEVLSAFSTRVVIPLVINEKETKIVNPEVEINGDKYIMLTTQMAGVPLNYFGKKVCSLEKKRSEIINAIDFVISGF